jgi:peptidoglycan/xylan/chitin deacetylase (PgdA/CDA1 family)
MLVTTMVAMVATPAARAADPTTLHVGTRHAETQSGGRVAVASTQIRQDGPSLSWSVELEGSREGTDFGHRGGGGICASLHTDGPVARLCLARRRSKWTAYLGRHRLSEPVELVGKRSLRVALPLSELGLRSGHLRWSVRARAARCAVTDGACGSRFPAKGQLRDQLWQPYAIGCARTGAGQVTAGPSTEKVMALTYDDGPSSYTAQVRAILKREHVVATFFELGQNIAGRTAEIRGLLADGNELADHSWNHANLGGGGAGATGQMSKTNATIRAATGFTPCLFRPPYGAPGSDLVSRANALGMTSVLWTVDTNDWQTPGAGTIASRVLAGAAPGHIVLMHDGGGPRGESVAASASVIPVLKREGYRLVTVSELLGNHTTYGLKPPA